MYPPFSASKLLWQHKDPTSTRMYQFKSRIEDKYNKKFTTYEQLRQWSIRNLSDFWEEIWHFTQVRASIPFVEVGEAAYFTAKMSRIHFSLPSKFPR